MFDENAVTLHEIMENLSKFFSVMELTREQQQYGFFLAGLNNKNTSNLAEHHYLVTMMGWVLCEYINSNELLIDSDAVIRMCLIHDVGELFGGDISAPLSRKSPELKTHARALEAANLDMITSFLPPRVQALLKTLHARAETRDTDEAVVSKFVDLLEMHYFLEHRSITSPQKDAFYANYIHPLLQKIIDVRIRKKLETFLVDVDQYINNKGFQVGNWVTEE